MNHYYLGLNGTTRELFKSSITPTEEFYGDKYKIVIGPFKTKRGAIFMRDYGNNNPHLQTVNDAERLSKSN
jgi:hypothetical protein